MKKRFTLFAFGMMLLSSTQAQTVPNAGLESWRTYSSGSANNLEAPDSWHGIDSLLYLYGPLGGFMAKKVLYKETTNIASGTAAAKLVSEDIGNGFIAPGVLVNAVPDIDINNFNPNDPLGSISYTGGLPVTGRIYSLSAMVKYTAGGGATSDYGVMGINVIKSGAGHNGGDSVIGRGTFFIPTNTTYTLHTAHVSYTDGTTVPDKIIISFSSSDLTGENGTSAQIGSELWVDDITISNVAALNNIYKNSTFATIFPIPAQSVLNIESEAKDASLSIYSMEGKLLLQKAFNSNTAIHTGNWANGTYFFEIRDEKNLMVQKGKFNILK